MARLVMATPLDMLDAHISWLRAGKYAKTTVHDAGKLLRRLHRDLPEGLHCATTEELADWLSSDPDWSDQTVSCYYKHMSRFYRWATAGSHPWISFDPSAELHRPTAQPGLPRPADHETVRAAIFKLRGQWRLSTRLGALAGLRPCEIATVDRSDVSAQRITIKGKGGKTRSIPTHALIWELVEPMPAGPLITGPKGRPATPDYVSKAGAYHLRRAGLEITMYHLRHYFGTRIQEKYRDARVTQELMGHASLNTTQNYTLVTSERARAAIDTLVFSDEGMSDGSPTPSPAAAPGGAARPQPTRSEGSGSVVAGRAMRRRLLLRVRR